MDEVSNKIIARSSVYHPETGHFISHKVQRVADVIADYNPELRLMHDPTNKEFGFAIGHFPAIGEPYVIMLVKEEEIDDRLLARLFTNDTARNNPLAYLDALEKAQKALELADELERREEMHDRAKSIFRTPLHTYRLGEGKKVGL